MTDQPTPKQPRPAADAKWLPVKIITFSSPTSIPGAASATILRGDITQANAPRWTIEYSPSWQIVKITHMTTNPSDEPKTVLVREWKTLEPMS